MQAPRFLALATIALAAAAAGCGYRSRGDDFPPAASGPLPTISPAFLADLQGVLHDCHNRGGELFVTLEVANHGGVAAGTFDTRVEVNRKQVVTRTRVSLAAGAPVRVGFLFTGRDSVHAPPGQMFTVTWSIDDPLVHPPFGEILESDKSNNTGTVICTVS